MQIILFLSILAAIGFSVSAALLFYDLHHDDVSVDVYAVLVPRSFTAGPSV